MNYKENKELMKLMIQKLHSFIFQPNKFSFHHLLCEVLTMKNWRPQTSATKLIGTLVRPEIQSIKVLQYRAVLCKVSSFSNPVNTE